MRRASTRTRASGASSFEELGWASSDLALSVRLMVAGEVMAWFYAAKAPMFATVPVDLARSAVLLAVDELWSARVSRWHQAAMGAHLAGHGVAHAAAED